MPANLIGGDRGTPIGDPAGGRDSYAFAVCGDPEGGQGTFREILRRAKAEGADFLIVCGDLTHRTLANWFRWWWRDIPAAGFERPVFAVAGSHDEEDWFRTRRDPTLYRWLFGKSPYAFRAGPDLFVGLDTNRWALDPSEREAFDRLDAEGGKRRHLFVFGHHPVIRSEGKRPARRSRVAGLFERLVEAKVAAFFAGHKHTYDRREQDGVLQIVTGRAGTYDLEGIAPNHFVLVRVGPAGVEDRRVDVPRIREGLLERYEFATAVRAFHFWQRHPAVGILLALALGAWALAGFFRLRPVVRRPGGPPPVSSP